MKFKWGILGTGGICKTFAESIKNSETGEVIVCTIPTISNICPYWSIYNI
ncbi:MAG: hypothetical protein M1501_02875 [Candidatus Omnitrophica bacterium]|nr:hypothetical protein [Candidatus Omnitrophota bacterium]